MKGLFAGVSVLYIGWKTSYEIAKHMLEKMGTRTFKF